MKEVTFLWLHIRYSISNGPESFIRNSYTANTLLRIVTFFIHLRAKSLSDVSQSMNWSWRLLILMPFITKNLHTNFPKSHCGSSLVFLYKPLKEFSETSRYAPISSHSHRTSVLFLGFLRWISLRSSSSNMNNIALSCCLADGYRGNFAYSLEKSAPSIDIKKYWKCIHRSIL